MTRFHGCVTTLPLSSRPELRTRISYFALPATTTSAALLKGSRMHIIKATNLDRKSGGGAQWSVCSAPRPNAKIPGKCNGAACGLPCGKLMIPKHQLGNRRQLHIGRAFVYFSDTKPGDTKDGVAVRSILTVYVSSPPRREFPTKHSMDVAGVRLHAMLP
jgi:hypothetical protein